MHLGRATQATSQWFTLPLVVQIGNSVRNFFAKINCDKCFRFDTKCSPQTPSGWELAGLFRVAISHLVFCGAVFLLVAVGIASSRAQIPGQLQNETMTLMDSTAGTLTIYRISFEVANDLPKNGKIILQFPVGVDFDISKVSVAGPGNGNNLLDGGLTVELDFENRIVAIKRDNTGSVLFGGTTGKLSLALVGNPTKTTTNNPYLISITTQTEGGSPIDQGEASITIKAGALDHFIFSSSPNGNITAGQSFDLIINGKDVYNNNQSFNGTLTLSDSTGSITPKSVTMNGASVSATNRSIPKAGNSVRITATGGGKSGTSNSFNVQPGPVVKFVFSAIDTVQEAGAAFPVTITAQDAFGNAATSFSGVDKKVSFKPKGEILPDSSGNFSNGIRSENIKYLKAGTKKKITVDDGNVAHISNSTEFTVKPGKPSGTVTLTATPMVLLANSATRSRIISTPIRDAQGNPVDAGRLFTLSATNFVAGSIDTAQVVATNKSSWISFSFKAGATGGLATVTAKSVDDPIVVGSVNINVNQIKILKIETTPTTVSQGQRDIKINMRVQNLGPNNVTITSAALNFNGDTTDYKVTPPTPLPTIPGNGTIQTLTFSVNVAATAATGVVAINGQISGILPGNIVISDQDADTTDTWTVQTPAKLSVFLQTSQAKVTQGQKQPWKVTMTVKNDGQSQVEVDLSDNSTRTSLASAGHTVSSPSGIIVIPGESFKALDFIVTATSDTAKGLRTIHGQVYAREINSDLLHFADTSVSGSTQITVQPQAKVGIESVDQDDVFNFDIDPVRNVDTVNTGQPFLVKVAVKQTVSDAEKVDTVWVRLQKVIGTAAIEKDTLALADLNQPVFFKVTAGNTTGKATLNAQILDARSANTHANTVLIEGGTKAVFVHIQKTDPLRIDSVSASEKKVRFGRTQPWSISLFVRNPNQTGLQAPGGTLVIESAQINFKVNGVVQNDYTLEKITPAAADSVLYAGRTNTLIYSVTKTGTAGGLVTIKATVYFHDKNSQTKFSVSASTTIVVESTALVTIAKTSFPVSMNRVPGTEIASVDTGQVFPINVTVRNTGFDKVGKTWVSLRSTTDKSKILNLNQQAVTGPIDTESDTAVATFIVRADGAANSLGEIFVAKIDSAENTAGAKVSIGRPLDSKDTTAVARIEQPAKLQLNLSTNVPNDLLTTGQTFTLRAVVKNLGQAQTDASGKLQVALPNANFNLMSPPPAKQSFAVGDTVKWQIRAPQQQRPADTLRVIMSPRPRSKNSGALAQVEKDTVATLVVSTFNSLLQITTTAVMDPLGAQDGVISTEQFFTVETSIIASNNLTNKTATLTLPPGYSFGSGQDSTKAIPDSGKVYWEVQAPTDAESKSVNLQVTAKARDGQAQPKQSQSTLTITTKRRAILNLTPGISEPSGAQGGVLSVGQPFTITANLANIGEANLTDTAEVELNIGDTDITVNGSLQKTVIFKPDSQVKTITWSARAPDRASSKVSELTFIIRRLPLDENTGKAALRAQNLVTLKLTTVNRGSIVVGNLRIVSPPGATDNVLSTGQDFFVSDTIKWTNAINVRARLALPPDFITENQTKLLETGSDVISWKVSAPSSAVPRTDLKVYVEANDAHDNTIILKDSSGVLSIRVVERADPQLRVFISNPPAARDGVVSAGQPFEVTAVIENTGRASLYDSATVSVDSAFLRNHGYALLAPSNPAITSSNLIFVWRIQARQDISIETDLIPFKLQPTPFDINTNQHAISTLSQVSLAVRTEGKKLVVEILEKGGGPAFRGDKNLPLLRLKLTNPAGIGSSNLMLKKLSFDLRDRDTTPVSANTALRAIRVVNEAHRDTLYGEIKDISAINSSALVVDLEPVVIAPDNPDTIAIMGDIAENATASHFRLVFDNSQDFTTEDQDGGKGVVVESNDGKRGSNFRLESNLAVLFDSEPEKSFYNYPNPIQPRNRFAAATHFTYYLPEASDGELKIFTLLGELVWELSFSAADPAGRQGPHKTDLSWDGFNGNGKKVLNGVYLAILKTKYGKAITKVAVVK
jgi:hypothetical protein